MLASVLTSGWLDLLLTAGWFALVGAVAVRVLRGSGR